MLTQRHEEKRVEERASTQEREQESQRAKEQEPFAPLFICFSLPLGLPYANWANQECCLFYLKSSLRSSDLPLTFLCSIFTGFSLPCLLATAILDFAHKGPSSQGYGFSCGHVWVWELDWRRLSTEELMLLNCGVVEDSWESLGLQGVPTSPS